MENYSAFIDTTHGPIQITISLPQSKIGATYPELYLCTRLKDGSLKYVWIDLTTKLIQDCDPADFMEHYTNGKPLTEDSFTKLGIFNCSLQTIAEGLCAALQTA